MASSPVPAPQESTASASSSSASLSSVNSSLIVEGDRPTPGQDSRPIPVTSISDSSDVEPWVDLRRYDQAGFQRGRSNVVVMLWWLLQAIIFPVTLHNASTIRVSLLRLFGAKIGKGVLIRPTARFTYPWKVEIGDHSWIGDDVVFYSLEQIRIGSHCIVSQKSYLCTGSHDIHDVTFRLEVAPIRIDNGAWVATDCFVAPGVTIGANAVIGARSSVFADMPAGQVCFGSPCKPRHERTMKA